MKLFSGEIRRIKKSAFAADAKKRKREGGHESGQEL